MIKYDECYSDDEGVGNIVANSDNIDEKDFIKARIEFDSENTSDTENSFWLSL